MPLALIAATPLTNPSFTKGREFGVTVGAVHGVALQEDRSADVMTARVGVVLNLVQQIAQVAVLQMMVRIDDRHCRIDRIFTSLSEPVFVNGEGDLLFRFGLANLEIHSPFRWNSELVPERTLFAQ
jgi:hypothetical protein